MEETGCTPRIITHPSTDDCLMTTDYWLPKARTVTIEDLDFDAEGASTRRDVRPETHERQLVMATDGITRRGFVEAVGISAGASTLLGAPAIAAGGSANEKIRLVLIGAGSRGNQLLDSFLKQPDIEIVGVVDVDDRHAGETADRIKKEKGNTPDTARDYRGMLDRKDVDAVIIATPDHWHALPAIQAVLAGKDVYVEKPVAHNVAEGQAMLRAARKTGKIMAVGTQQRSSSHFQKAVEIVRSGQLGKVFWVQTWNFENISPVGLGSSPTARRPPTSTTSGGLAPLRCVPSTPIGSTCSSAGSSTTPAA